MLLKPRFSRAAAARGGWAAELPDFAQSLAWSADGRALAVASLAGPVVIFDGETGASIVFDEGHRGGALTLAWSPDGLLASGGQDGMIRLFSIGEAALVGEVEGGGDWVEHLAWSPSGDCLASAAGKTVRVWSQARELLAEVTGYESTVSSLFWHPGKQEIVTSCYGGLQFLEVGKPEWIRKLDWKGSILTSAPSPDGRFIATGNQDASVHVWEVRSGKDLQMTGYPLKVRELAWCGNGPLLATGGSAVITVWSFAGRGPAGKPAEELNGHEARVTGLSFLPGSTRLVSVGEDQTVRTWEPGKGWRCSRTEKLETPLHSLAVSPDGKRAAVAGDGGLVTIWPL